MTMTSNQQMLPLTDECHEDQRPGLSEVEWAERPYSHGLTDRVNMHRSAPRPHRQRWRMLVVLAMILAAAGLVVASDHSTSKCWPVVFEAGVPDASHVPHSAPDHHHDEALMAGRTPHSYKRGI
jgi:hypothetical protein